MTLPRPPEKYETRWATEQSRQLDVQWDQTHRRGADVELGQNERLIMRSPNGVRWSITVSDSGILSATSL